MTQTREVYLDAGRGVAILMVIAVHVSQNVQNLSFLTLTIYGFGAAGVQLFFLISGISLCLSFEHRKEKIIYFYIRRFFRIAPLYWLAIFFYNGILLDFSKPEIITNFLFIHNLIGNMGIVPGGWSIGTEMIFYLFFPLIFILTKIYKFYFVFITIIFLSLIYYFLNIFTWKFEVLNKVYVIIFHWTFIQWIAFIMGIIFFIKKFSLKKIILNTTFLIFFLFISIISYKQVLNFKIINFYPTQIFLVSLFSIFLLLFLKHFLKNDNKDYLLCSIGRYSYSLYIFHQIGIHFATKLMNLSNFKYDSEVEFFILYFLVLAISFFISYFSYNYLEKKGINIGHYLIKKIKL